MLGDVHPHFLIQDLQGHKTGHTHSGLSENVLLPHIQRLIIHSFNKRNSDHFGFIMISFSDTVHLAQILTLPQSWQSKSLLADFPTFSHEQIIEELHFIRGFPCLTLELTQAVCGFGVWLRGPFWQIHGCFRLRLFGLHGGWFLRRKNRQVVCVYIYIIGDEV